MSGIPDSLGGFFMTPRNGIRLQSEGQLVGIPVCSCLFGPPFHHRRHAEIENAIRDLKYGVGLNHMPSGRFATNGAWLAVQVMAHNLARWTARIGLEVWPESICRVLRYAKQTYSRLIWHGGACNTLQYPLCHR